MTLDTAVWIWLALTVASTAYVAWDLVAHTPEMTVMKWGWGLVMLYTGPVGLVVYGLSCREPALGTHEAFVAPRWKQATGSTIHCLAGDATGIIAAAAVTSALGLPMGVDAVLEYVAGFAFGLLVFQALFMKDMLGGSYAEALRRTWYPEWVSMNVMMSGMVSVMIVLMTRDMAAMEPTSPRFWAVMSLATVVGAVIAFPFNWWLVATGLKHGMGTDRALGKGGEPAGPVEARVRAAEPMGHPAGHGASGSPATPPVSEARPAAPTAHGMETARDTSTRAGKVAVALLSLVLLAAGVAVAARYGDLSMRPGEHEMPGVEMPGMEMP